MSCCSCRYSSTGGTGGSEVGAWDETNRTVKIGGDKESFGAVAWGSDFRKSWDEFLCQDKNSMTVSAVHLSHHIMSLRATYLSCM